MQSTIGNFAPGFCHGQPNIVVPASALIYRFVCYRDVSMYVLACVGSGRQLDTSLE